LKEKEIQRLALALLKCESEEDVIHLLKEFGLWNQQASWQVFGQNENNFSVIGAQQNSADAALVEKIRLSIVLMLYSFIYKSWSNFKNSTLVKISHIHRPINP
jgi:hypothetical protein